MTGPANEIPPELGIHRIETPTPYSEFPTNSYYIDGETPTLIDTGIAYEDPCEEAYEALAEGLSKVHRSVGDIERIILTHGHADHRALTQRLCEESGAEVLFHPLAAGKVLKGSLPGDETRPARIDIFRRMGAPEQELAGLADGTLMPVIDPDTVATRFIDEGDELDFDKFALEVLHTPGHSCDSICLYDKASGILFSGDTILSNNHVTALLELEMLCADPGYSGLKLHMDSLERLRGLNASLILPGHGSIFRDYGTIVDGLLGRHAKRRNHILRSLRNGRRSLYQICKSTFLFASPDDLFLALSEVSGNINILMDEGKILMIREDDLEYYEKA
jgi:glyoxylase-like metal-dependent hydrolase (beta-lactamase superfamily II)